MKFNQKIILNNLNKLFLGYYKKLKGVEKHIFKLNIIF